MEYKNNTLFNIQTNRLVLKDPIFPDFFEIETINNDDFLIPKVRDARENTIHQGVSALVDFLSIGSFVKNEMLLGTGIKEADQKTLKNNRFYPLLITKISDFLKKYSVQKSMNYNENDFFEFKIHLFGIVRKSFDMHDMITFIMKFREEEQKNKINHKPHKPLIRTPGVYPKLLINSFESKVSIMPRISTTGINVLYTFESLFDMIDYQFILFLGNTQDYDVGICPYCNTFFIKKSRDKIYCKPQHSNAARLRDNQLKSDFALAKYCKLDECGKPFTPDHQRQEYCNPKCKKRAEYLKAKEKRKSEYEW